MIITITNTDHFHLGQSSTFILSSPQNIGTPVTVIAASAEEKQEFVKSILNSLK